ncbi:MAG: CinA family nicotinamide mononucleotide deamidase-related protein [Thermoflavifilum aggregans]|nr:CinA family nicotinamide mononucleotide deamidase-related protein [Thermoflavifilum aggregans]
MPFPQAIILTIGDELLLGETLDTNSAWIATKLHETGFKVLRRISVGDDQQAILQALQEESARTDLLIMTGGLGPTSDDITKTVLCDFFHTRLVLHESTLQHITSLLQQRGTPLLERNRAQALVPEGCTVLPNPRGTAPGLWFENMQRIWIALPGVPHEMKGLLEEEVLPRLKQKWPALQAIQHRYVLTYGQGESQVAERLVGFEASLPENIRLAYLPGNGLLKLRLSAADSHALQLLDDYHQQLIALLSDIVVGTENLPYELLIAQKLLTKKATLALAESCTGGYLAHLFTSHPGSSAYFTGSLVCYSPEVKVQWLNVPAEWIQQPGVVSEPVARAMAEGIRQKLHTDYALAITGWLGPDGGTPEAPVGTVWIAAAHQSQTLTRRHQLRGDRQRNLVLSATHALHLLDELIRQTS